MNDYIIQYVVYSHDKSFVPLESRKTTIKAYCEAEAIEKFPYWSGLITKISKK
jgi:hypothetical protein